MRQNGQTIKFKHKRCKCRRAIPQAEINTLAREMDMSIEVTIKGNCPQCGGERWVQVKSYERKS